MSSERTIAVFANPRARDADAVRSAVKKANAIQRRVHFELREASWLPQKGPVAISQLTASVDRHNSAIPDYAVVVIQPRFQDTYFAHWRETISYLSLDQRDGMGLPSLSAYILFHFAFATAMAAGDLRNDEIDWEHDEGAGCLFDGYEYQRDLRRVMIAGFVCGACRTALAGQRADIADEVAIERILAYVRDHTLGRRPGVADKVFIGHGHSHAWHTVKEIVTDTGLHCIEFEMDGVAPRAVKERLEEMLSQARFAILVVTGEVRAGDTLHARPNVIHEIGLCQGRLGFDQTLVLQQEGTELFSNLAGLMSIRFRKNDVAAKRRQIVATLRRAGLLSAREARLRPRRRGA